MGRNFALQTMNNLFDPSFIMYPTSRPLGAIYCCSDGFTAGQMGATQWAPVERGPAGECVGQPKNGDQRQGQTW